MFALDLFNLSHDFSLHVGFGLLKLQGDWFLQAQNRILQAQNRIIFLNLPCECLYLQPPQIYSFS